MFSFYLLDSLYCGNRIDRKESNSIRVGIMICTYGKIGASWRKSSSFSQLGTPRKIAILTRSKIFV